MLADSVTLSYHGRTVVHRAELELEPGLVTALVGPNGSGKSTLLRALAGLHAPDAGRVLLDGVGIGALGGRDLARRVTMLAQSRPTPGGLTVRELVEFGRHPHRPRFGGRDPGAGPAIARAMALTGLADLADEAVDRLSGGQVQRAWLAACLAQETDVLLLDEPTTYLDLRFQVELLDLVRDLADDHGVTVGVVLHDLDQAAAVADRIVLVEAGRVRAVGTPEDVLVPELLSSAYGIRVDVDRDADGAIRTRPRGRFHARRPAGLAVA